MHQESGPQATAQGFLSAAAAQRRAGVSRGCPGQAAAGVLLGPDNSVSPLRVSWWLGAGGAVAAACPWCCSPGDLVCRQQREALVSEQGVCCRLRRKGARIENEQRGLLCLLLE